MNTRRQVIFICLGSYNNLTAWWLKHQTFMEAEEFKSEAPVDLVPSEDRLPGSQMADFSLRPHVAERESPGFLL